MAMEPAAEYTPLEYLSRADKELAFGNHRKAAGYLWQATEATFIGLAKERELDCGDLSAVAIALEANGGAARHRYSSSLADAKTLREHAESECLEGYQQDMFFEAARKFLVKCHGEPE